MVDARRLQDESAEVAMIPPAGLPLSRRRAPRATAPSDPVPAWKRALGIAEGLTMMAALLAVGGSLAATYERSLADERIVPGLSIEDTEVGGMTAEEARSAAARAADARLERPLLLRAGDVQSETTAARLGGMVEIDEAWARATQWGRSGRVLEDVRQRARARDGVSIALGLGFDQSVALQELLALAPKHDRPSLPARLDLAGRRVTTSRIGTTLLPYDSLSDVAIGLAEGADTIELAWMEKPPAEENPRLADLDVSVLLGTFSTPYRMDASHADRTHNLKLGAAAIDGVILLPGEEFSFNEVVGPRSAEAGYRYAPGITGGELVDVLGGGICQVATSLYGAAFFSGSALESSRPHSRPSSYVDMGLDATVVYPTIDLKLKNPYEFPIALHMRVSQGTVLAEVLGPRRPYTVAFEREVQEVVPFPVVERGDPNLPVGASRVTQRGLRGFSVIRRRRLMEHGDEVKVEERRLNYPPTSEIRYVGTGGTGAVPEPRKWPALREPKARLRIVQ
jgi:vancomycin resistance protein YoaR